MGAAEKVGVLGEGAGGLSEGEAPSVLVLGLRFFALAIVASAAAVLPRGRVEIPLAVASIAASVALAMAQHAAMRSGRPNWAFALIPLHAVVWTLLVHAGGGPRSPLIVGYLLELPLSAALFSRRGVLVAAAAATVSYLLYEWRFAATPSPLWSAGLVLVCLGVCGAITWRLAGMLERHRAGLAASRSAIARSAETLEEALRRLGDSLSAALLSIDPSGRLVAMNPAAGAMLRVNPGAVLGLPWQQVLSPDREGAARLLVALDSGEAQRAVRMVLALPTGPSVVACAEIWSCPSPAGRLAYVLLEPETAPGADDPLRRLGEGAAFVAHQIKNSIHGLQGLVAGLERESGTAATERCLAVLQSLGGLATDVLATAGANQGAEPVVIQDALRQASLLLPPSAVRLGVPEEPLRVRACRAQLIHAFFNLMDNAARANPPGLPVEVHAAREAARVWVDIVDVGPGVPPEIAAGCAPAPSARGAGWGLLAARRFVEESGGRLTLVSSGHGTRCRIDLPAAVAAVS